MSKFTILENEINFSDAQDRFIELAQIIPTLKKDARDYFQEVFEDRWDNIEDVLDEYNAITTTLIDYLLKEKLYAYLISADIYDISEDAMMNECIDLSAADESYNIIAKVYNRIREEYDEKVEYRQLRKANRSRVIGGGVGFSGAVKGMAMAGAINAITGLGHGIANAIGDLKSSIDADNAKEELFENDETYSILETGVVTSLIATIESFVCFINDYRKSEGEDIWFDSSKFDVQKAETLLSNAVRFKEKRSELLVKAFINCPYYQEVLEAIFVAYPSERKNTVKICIDLNIDLSTIFEKVINTMYPVKTDDNNDDDDHDDSINNNKYNSKYSEDDLIDIRTKIVTFMTDFDIKESSTFDQLEKHLICMIAEDYKHLEFDNKKDILSKITSCEVSDDIKKECIYDYEIWELFEPYKVNIPVEKKAILIYKKYEEICSIKDISSQKIIEHLDNVINAVNIRNEDGLIDFDVKEVLFESLTGILSEKFQTEAKMLNLKDELTENMAEKITQIIQNANVDFLTTSLKYRMPHKKLDTSELKYCTMKSQEIPFIIYDESPILSPGTHGFCLTDKRLIGRVEYIGKYEIPTNQIIGFEKKGFLSNRIIVITKKGTHEIDVGNLSSIGDFVNCLNQIIIAIPNNIKTMKNNEAILNRKIAQLSITYIEKHPWLISYFGMEEKVEKLRKNAKCKDTATTKNSPKKPEDTTKQSLPKATKQQNICESIDDASIKHNTQPSNIANEHTNQTTNPFNDIDTMLNTDITNALLSLKAKHGCDKYYIVGSEPFAAKINKAIKAYANITSNERPIMMEDATIFGSAKEGFVFTNKRVYIKRSFTAPYNVSISEIKNIVCEAKGSLTYIYILVNNQKLELAYVSTMDEAKRCVNLINELIKAIQTATTTTLSIWKCTCGKENSGNFCSKCGKPKNNKE